MRLGRGGACFDLTDAGTGGPVDSLDEVLGVACSVIDDCAGVDSGTRIERMARFIALRLHLDAIKIEKAGGLAQFSTGSPLVTVHRCGGLFGIGSEASFVKISDPAAAAVLLLLAAEDAEQDASR